MRWCEPAIVVCAFFVQGNEARGELYCFGLQLLGRGRGAARRTTTRLSLYPPRVYQDSVRIWTLKKQKG